MKYLEVGYVPLTKFSLSLAWSKYFHNYHFGIAAGSYERHVVNYNAWLNT